MGGLIIWGVVEVADERSKVDQRAREVDQWARSVQVDRNRGLFADWLIDEWAPKTQKHGRRSTGIGTRRTRGNDLFLGFRGGDLRSPERWD